MKQNLLASNPITVRWVLLFALLAVVLFSPIGIPDLLAAATDTSGTAKDELNLNNAYTQAKSAGGISVLLAMFFLVFFGCLATGLVLSAIGILSFMRTHEWTKLQNNLVAICFLFALSGVFFWLMSKEGSNGTFNPVQPSSITAPAFQSVA